MLKPIASHFSTVLETARADQVRRYAEAAIRLTHAIAGMEYEDAVRRVIPNKGLYDPVLDEVCEMEAASLSR